MDGEEQTGEQRDAGAPAPRGPRERRERGHARRHGRVQHGVGRVEGRRIEISIGSPGA